uniref:Reverse transcriptase Ty1/copia-type domain-containing protein n=1 Tax=Tanacetum cinerariifolium TaxID=118510 RepID=A0A6L2MT94_TANCI|nr:hypothetical protein [Tanacetum cinerariifolium]
MNKLVKGNLVRVATACYVLNRVLVTKPHDKTPYEILTEDKPFISYLKRFGCHVTILNTSDPLGKFDKKIQMKVILLGTGQAWMFDIDYLTNSLNYSRVSSTNLTAGSQGATPSNTGSQEDDSDSDDKPDVLIIQSTPTLVVPIVDEATAQNDGTKSDLAKTIADNLDELAELQALQRQEQAGTEEADRVGLAFPSLNPILGVGSASIGSSISAGSTPPVSAANTPPMSPCASPISADRHFISAGKSHVSAGRPIGSAGRPVSAGRPSGSADRTPVPVGRILGKFTANASSERFPRASSEFSGPDANNLESSLDVSSTITKRIHSIHPTSQVLGDINSPVQTRSQVKHKGSSESAFISYIHDKRRNNHTNFQLCMFSCFLSQKEPTTVAQALADPDWVEAMQAEIQQFRNQKVWVLVTLPNGKQAIGTKWILKNKRDAKGIVCRNKARLVAQGHIQEERIDYIDVFALVARIKAIRLFLAFASFMGFRVYQMDVKSAFLYGMIAKELYVTQPRGFEDPYHPKKVYKVVKALPDGIFIHQEKYVADILRKFDLANSKLAFTPFEPQKIREKNVPDEPISVHLYRSMIGCLMYLTATRPDIMFAVCAAARHQVTPKTSNLLSVKRILKYLTAYLKLGLWYPRDSPFDLEAFSDSDYAGANGDRKSTTGGCTMDSEIIARLWYVIPAGDVFFLLETTYVSAGATIAAGDLIPAVTSVSAASSIPATTPIAAGVSTTAGASGSASEASILIIELLDSPLKDTSLPLDPKTEELDEPFRKSSRKKSIARKRTLPGPFKPKSDALPFDEDYPEAEFKWYLRQASDDDEPAELVSLALVSDITTWELIPTEFGHGEIHVITRADGTVKRFSTLRELMYWAGRADLMVLYGLVSDKYKTERATAGDIMYMFVDKNYPLTPETIQQMLNHGLEIDRDPSGNDLTTAIQLIQSLLNQLNPAT